MAAAKKPPVEADVRLTPAQLVAQADKEFGPGVLIKGSSIKNRTFRRTSTGCLGFDYALGGGWAVNQWCEIVGRESSGKTALALRSLAEIQDKNKKAIGLWVAAESFVPDYAESYGVDLNRLWLVESNIMEVCFKTVLLWSQNRACDFICIDSYPAMVSQAEDDGDMNTFQPGVGARQYGKFLRKSGVAQRRSLTEPDRDCTLLVINQWREKIGVIMGDPRTTPGGLSKNYNCFIQVETKRDKFIEVDKQRVGIEIVMQTRKNKTAPVGRAATASLYFEDTAGFRAGEFDIADDILRVAQYMEIVKRGKPMYSYRGRGWPSRAAIIQSIREEVELREQLRNEVLRYASLPPADIPKLPPVRPTKVITRR